MGGCPVVYSRDETELGLVAGIFFEPTISIDATHTSPLRHKNNYAPKRIYRLKYKRRNNKSYYSFKGQTNGI